MRVEDLVFWLDVPSNDPDAAPGALCARHADSMVVPRGWTLDDLRDPHLHLFRPPQPTTTHRPASGRVVRCVAVGEQLRFGVDPLEPDDDSATGTSAPTAAEQEQEQGPGPWIPAFDEADDLDGLLRASSLLLSRAFRTVDGNDR